jgi:uncharacterized membrane protein
MNPPKSIPATPGSDVTRVELAISNLLRIGVAASVAVIILGTVISFVHHPGYLQSAVDLPALTAPGKAVPNTLHDTIEGIGQLHGQAIVTLGLLMLIATPVLRVAVSIIAFMVQKDRVFMVITAVVLGLLLLSFVLGKAG